MTPTWVVEEGHECSVVVSRSLLMASSGVEDIWVLALLFCLILCLLLVEYNFEVLDLLIPFRSFVLKLDECEERKVMNSPEENILKTIKRRLMVYTL